MTIASAIFPATLYAAGGSADIWSSNPPQGVSYVERSPLGRVAGPIVASAAFAGADAILGHSKHRGWQKVLRLGYVAGTILLVMHNRHMRPN